MKPRRQFERSTRSAQARSHRGVLLNPEKANYNGNYVYGGGSKGKYRERTVPVDSFAANPWGLHNVLGNVWEWVEDCWNDSYVGAPADGTPWTTGQCNRRVVRGGSWFFDPRNLRSASRRRISAVNRYNYSGFRLARTLNP